MPLESQKMIVGNQKPPSIICQQGRLGGFCVVFCLICSVFFFFPLNSSFLFVWVFCMQIIHRQYAPPAKHQETI